MTLLVGRRVDGTHLMVVVGPFSIQQTFRKSSLYFARYLTLPSERLEKISLYPVEGG